MPVPAKPSKRGRSGWDWMYPTHKELDPSLAYSAGKTAYISPLNPIYTDGLTDLVDVGSIKNSPPGVWLCVQDCPPATWDNPLDYSSGTYNAPQLPLPGSGAVPSGTLVDGVYTPMKGDADGSNVFWVPIAPATPCFG